VNAKRKRRSHGRARAAARLARTAATVRSGGPLGARIRSTRSLLVIVDMQERVASAVADAPRVQEQCEVLVRAAGMLGVPVVVTEHCPQQLGPTVASLRGRIPAGAIHAKTHFAAADEPALAQHIAAYGRPQIVIAGVEAHVCVLQTAIALAERGYTPYVVADATGSRLAESRALALERLRGAGIQAVSTEMVLFEWLEHADRRELRELLALIK
jgi:nicotinamidase-related amidase